MRSNSSQSLSVTLSTVLILNELLKHVSARSNHEPEESNLFNFSLVLSFLILLFIFIKGLHASLTGKANTPLKAHQQQLPTNNIEPSNETRLISLGYTDDAIRDNPIFGQLYDDVQLSLINQPVILNTGKIVDESTAKALVSRQAYMPQGKVTHFFKSPQLNNLLTALVNREVEEHEQRAASLLKSKRKSVSPTK